MFGWAASEHKIILKTDNGHIAGHYPIWFQTTLTAMVSMFEKVGLLTNSSKTKAMV